MGFIPRLALLGSAAYCGFAGYMFVTQPHFAADPQFKSDNAMQQWDHTVDKVLYDTKAFHPKVDVKEDSNGLVSFIMIAGAMYAAVGVLFLMGAVAWGPSGSFFRSVLNLWSLLFCGAVVYANTVWPVTLGSDPRPCESHDAECLNSMNRLFKMSNLPLIMQMVLNLLGLLLREGTVIHKIYAEKISTGTISDPLLP